MTAHATQRSFESLLSTSPNPWVRRILDTEAARSLHRSIENELFLQFGSDSNALLVASATSDEGRTTVAMITSVLAALRDPVSRVLVIDADTNSGQLSENLGLQRDQLRLSDYFEGAAEFDDTLATTSIPNLFAAGLGREEGEVTRFSFPAFERYMNEARERFQLIVVDSAAVHGNRGVVSLAKIVGSAVFVVQYAGPTREQIQPVIGDLRRTGAHLIGAVINRRVFPVPRLLYGR